jgi:MFS family permease
MNFFSLIAAAFLGGFGLGFVKFFLLGHLCHQVYSINDKDWIIQLVGAVITAGPWLVYVVSGPLAAAYRKGAVMFWSGSVSAGGVMLGALSNWSGTAWLYIFLTGLVMGIFNPAKNAAIPLEAALSGRSTELINAALNISYIAGLLAGIPSGAWLYDAYPAHGGLMAVLILAGASACGNLCRYPEEAAHLQGFKTSFLSLIRDSSFLLKKYPVYLLVSPLIWGIASAVSLAVTAFAEQRGVADAVAASFMSVYAAVGVAAGNAITPKMVKVRHGAAALASAGMALVILAIPGSVCLLQGTWMPMPTRVLYWVIVALVVLLGLCFGIATNLLEAEFFSLVYKDRKEGTGAALLSAGTALFPFVLGGTIGLSLYRGWVTAASQFYWVAAASALAAGLILRLAIQKGVSNTLGGGGTQEMWRD